MSITKAILQGIYRALSSPGLVLWLWLASFVIALPGAWLMTRSIHASVGTSLINENLRTGFDTGWFGEFEAQAKGIETTFSPTLLGAGAFFDNIETWFTGGLFKSLNGVAAFGILYALVWALFLGGILERFAKPTRRFTMAEFFSNGGKHFFRFVRLGLLSAPLYYLVYRFARWLLRRVDEMTRDVTVERTALMYFSLAAAVIVLLLCLVKMAFDYAKIATVLESRRSMLFAALRGFGFVAAHPLRTAGVFYGVGVLGLLLLALYAWVAPGAGQSTWLGVFLALAVGQGYLVAKLVVRLSALGGQMALFEATMRPPRAARL